MDRAERLLNLVAELRWAERPLPRDELRERVYGDPPDDDAFRRSFERDKEALRAIGVPISVHPIDPYDPTAGEGYRVLKADYELPDPGLEPDELAALHLAASAVRFEDASAGEALRKLGGLAGRGAEAEVVSLPGAEHLSDLFTATAERRTVTFTYKKAPRTVDPWRIAFRGGRWYVTGYDRDRGGRRSFRLDRFESAPEAGPPKAFEAPQGADLVAPKPWEMGEEEPVVAEVLVDASQARFAVQEAGEEAVVDRRADGSVVLQLRVTARSQLRSFVFGFLDHAEVLGPPELRAEIVDSLEALCAGRH